MGGYYADSFEKIVHTYFTSMVTEPFEYNGKTVAPKPLVISPGIFRDYTCPENCGGCCRPFSLIWLPYEVLPPEYHHVEPRLVSLNGQPYLVVADMQQDRWDAGEHYCRNVRMEDGRCGIHKHHPFSCDFELLRFTQQNKRVLLNTRLFGRGWSYTRVTGEKGAACSIVPGTEITIPDVIRRLRRLQEWLEYFDLYANHVKTVAQWVSTGPHTTPLRLFPAKDWGEFPSTQEVTVIGE